MRGQPLPIHGDGSNVRSYLYGEDVAEAFEVILHKGGSWSCLQHRDQKGKESD
ncbi:putative NAD(P)-binding domain superfamily [Helianthus anomalus]